MSNNSKKPRLIPMVLELSFPVLFIVLVGAGAIFEATQGASVKQRLEKFAESKATERKVDADKCLEKTTPWRCIVEMSERDRDDSIMPNDDIRRSRTHYVVAHTDVSVSFEFCKQAQEENCAERLVEAGYSTESVLDAVLAR